MPTAMKPATPCAPPMKSRPTTCCTSRRAFSKGTAVPDRGFEWQGNVRQIMNIGQLLQILWARRGLVFMVTLLAFALVVVLELVRPRHFAATTSLVIDSRS